MVVGGVEEAAGRIGEARQDAIHQGAGGLEPALVEGRLVQRQQAVGEIRVVLEHAGADRPAVLPRAAERPIRPEQAIHDRGRRASGRARVRRRGVWIDGRQGGRGVGQGGDGQAVPGRQRLAVTGRLRPRRAPLEEPAPVAAQPRPDLGLGQAVALGQLRHRG